MRHLLTLLALTIGTGAQAQTISSGSFAAGEFVSFAGNTNSAPGIYTFRLALTAPSGLFFGEVMSLTSYNDYCDDGSGSFAYCGGNDIPNYTPFQLTAPNTYTAQVSVFAPYSTTYPGGRTDYTNLCCSAYGDFLAGAAGRYTLTVTSAATAAPEPESWALMILGFGAIGAFMRRKHHGTKAIAASI